MAAAVLAAACASVGVMFCGRGQHFCCKACTDIGYIIANCFDFIRNRTARGCCTKILSMIAICNHSHTRPRAPSPLPLAPLQLHSPRSTHFISFVVHLFRLALPLGRLPKTRKTNQTKTFWHFAAFQFFIFSTVFSFSQRVV